MPIGSLVVKVGADIKGIQSKSKQAAGALGGIGQSASALNTVLKGLAIGLVANKLKNMVGEAIEAIDVSAKLSKQLGGTIDGLEGLKLAASEAGVSTGAMQKGMEMLNRRMAEAARLGSGQAYEAFQRLNLSVEKLSALDVDERMAAIADAMSSAKLSTQQVADVMGQLGIRTGEMTRIMMGGGDAIRDARSVIDDLGLSLSAVDAAKVEQAKDMMARAKMAATSLSRAIAVKVAPMLTALSKRFVAASASSKTLAERVNTAAEWIGRAAGFIGDSLRGVHIVFKTLELGGVALNTALIEVFRDTFKTISVFADKIIGGPVNYIIKSLNRIRGVEIEPVGLSEDSSLMRALDSLADAARETTSDVESQLRDLATSEWPSDNIKRFFSEVEAEAEAAAQKAAAVREEVLGYAEKPAGPSDADKREADALRAKLDRQLEMLREHAMSQEQLEVANHEKRMAQLRDLLEAEEITKAEYRSLAEAFEKKHMTALADIRKKGMAKVADLSVSAMAGSVNTIIGLAASLADGMDKESKTAFDLQKAAAISSAVISGAQGVAQTYGAFPFPINIPFAAAHAALAAAQVAMIASKQFKGGSSAVAAPPPSVPSGAATQAASTGGGVGGVSGGQGAVVNISATGDTFSRQTVYGLIDQINNAIGDGARIKIT